MKRFCFLFAVLILMMPLCSCSSLEKCLGKEIRITDKTEYKKIWTLSDLRYYEKKLFPETIENEAVDFFECIHVEEFLVGTDWQVLLKIHYDREQFDSEIDRLSALCKDSFICGKSDYFDCPAFASIWNANLCFEYAVVDEQESSISYIYLQGVKKEEIKITSLPLPKGYDWEMKSPQLALYP